MSPKGSNDQEQDLLVRHLKANAPVSIVKAAKASLKEPSRPYTPLESNRHLFSTNDSGGNRPSSSYGTPTSKLFYDGNSKLATPKSNDPYGASPLSRPDKPRSILDGSLGGLLGSSSLNDNENSPTRLLGPSSGRQTAAETVAALKASLSAGVGDRMGLGLGGGAGAGVSQGSDFLRRRPSAGGSQISLPPKGPLPDDEDGVGEVLDPHRNDDLPVRPTTSRGRLSAATPPLEDPFVPAPAPVRLGSDTEVLRIAQDASDSDSPDDEEYRHLYSYAVPRPAEELALDKDPGRDHDEPADPRAAAAAGSSGSSPVQPPPPAPDAGTSLSAWRTAVEHALTQMLSCLSALAAAPPARGAGAGAAPAPPPPALSELLQHTSTLAVHVQYMRRQPNSSAWLNAPSSLFREAAAAGGGQAPSVREAISEVVFRLMDSSSSELLLKGCAIVLRVVKSRQPLLQASKLLYRLSKDTGNDRLFRSEALLEPILRTISNMVVSAAVTSASASGPTPPGPSGGGGVSSMHESLVFLNGCLKNVSNDKSNQRALVKLGALQAMAAVLSQMAAWVTTGASASELGRGSGGASLDRVATPPTASTSDMASQVTVQVTGVLRNLAVAPAHAPVFVSSGVLQALREAASALSQQQEVVLNVGRILSKLSLHDDCQAAIEADPAYAPLLVRLLTRHAGQRAVLLRIAFVLGNLTTGSNDYRAQVAAVPGALDAVVSILARYSLEDEWQDGEAVEAGAAGTASATASAPEGKRSQGAKHEECVVKMLRLAANLSIHVEVGPLLAARPEVAESLLALLGQHSFEEAEELVLNCVCALTNLSFYHQPPGNRVLEASPMALLRHVTPLLLCDNEEAQVEAARAYGNFSRLPPVRDYIRDARVLEAMLLLLDHSNLELLYSICGTLINLTADRTSRAAIVGMGGVARLIEVLERVASAPEVSELESAILSVVFKALYNLCAEDAMPGEPLAAQPAVSEDEICGIGAIVEAVRCSEELGDDVVQLAERCAAQLQLISRKFESLNLEPLS